MKHPETFVQEIARRLEQQGAFTKHEVKSLLASYKDQDDLSFEEFLLDEGIDKQQVLQALAAYFNVPAIDVIGEFFDHYLLHLFPKDVMLRAGFIPYTRELREDTLYVIAANPDYPNLRHIIGQYVSHDISFMVGFITDIRESIEEYYDESIVDEPDHIFNQRMERSMIDPHPSDQIEIDSRIPVAYQETNDDYEAESYATPFNLDDEELPLSNEDKLR